MKKFGFFCFSLALIFALTTFALSDAASAIKERISEAKTIALSLEQAGLKRFELEQNADKAIQFAIEKSIHEGKDSTEQLKQSADAALFALFEEEKSASEETEFYWASASNKQYAQLGFFKKNTLKKKEIEASSKALKISIRNLHIIEYGITGGLLKNKVFFAIIKKPGTEQFFLIPIDYSNKTTVVR